MVYNIGQSFAVSHPPLLVFTICLMAFGLTMIVLAYVIGEHDIPNPDVYMDWNKLFIKISLLKFCIPAINIKNNESISSNAIKVPNYRNNSYNVTELEIINEEKSMSAVLSNVVGSKSNAFVDFSSLIEISVKVVFKVNGMQLLANITHFKGSVKGKHLGLLGKYSSHLFNISFNLHLQNNSTCISNECETLWDSCITLNLPAEFLQETKHRTPEKCEMENAFNTEILGEISSQRKISDSCLDLEYIPNTKFTEMLSLHDRSIVNLHLMHTSYFMFVMVMTLICYSLIRGRYRHSKALFEKIPAEA